MENIFVLLIALAGLLSPLGAKKLHTRAEKRDRAADAGKVAYDQGQGSATSALTALVLVISVAVSAIAAFVLSCALFGTVEVGFVAAFFYAIGLIVYVSN